MKRASMDRFIDTIEWIAAGIRRHRRGRIFSSRCCCATSSTTSIPDSFDIGRLLLGILIFWGIAATSYRGTHITVDLVWANAGPKYQRMIDVFATLVLLFVVSVQTWTLFDKVRGTYNDHVTDLRHAHADLAVLRGGVGRRRFRRAADRDPHLPADLPSGADARSQDQGRRSSRR